MPVRVILLLFYRTFRTKERFGGDTQHHNKTERHPQTVGKITSEQVEGLQLGGSAPK